MDGMGENKKITKDTIGIFGDIHLSTGRKIVN